MPSAAKAKREAAKALKAESRAQKAIQKDASPSEEAPAAVSLVFPASLSARQRAILHSVGELHGLVHASSGDGDQRKLSLGPQEGPVVDLSAEFSDSDAPLTDATLVALLQRHLRIDATSAFLDTHPTHNAAKFSGKQHQLSSTAGGSKRHEGVTSSSSAGYTGAGGSGVQAQDLPKFVALMQELVELERCAEVTAAEEALSNATPEQAQGRGRALLNLRLSEVEGGLLGRTLLTLVRNKPGGDGEETLPPHKFSPHDIVRLRAAKSDSGATLAQGVIYRVKETSITVAVDDVPEDGLEVPLKLEKLANEVTYERLRGALRALSDAGDKAGPGSKLVEVLFGGREPRFAPLASLKWQPVNSGLDASQRQAVALALTAADIALIQGPPGTGKTTTVVEIVLQEVARGSRVLVCAASNIAVDNLVERLAGRKLPGLGKKVVDVVRVGHPARLLPAVLDSSLEAKVLRSDDSALARDCRAEIKDLNSKIMKLGRRDRAERTAMRRDLRRLAKEERQRQERAVAAVLSSASVVCTTLTGVGVRQLAALPPFDVAVIDEAAQALEPASWAALLRGNRAVLAGDHLQLPPTVTSEEAARRGLSVTLFERAHAAWGSTASVMLRVQYRMNKAVMQWSSDAMYGGLLEAALSVADHTLAELTTAAAVSSSGSNGDETPFLPVLLLIDTAGCEMEEEVEEGSESRMNRGEAAAAIAHVQRLMAAGVAARDIGVITPYAAQVGLVRELRPEGAAAAVEVSTVDGFQGREKEAIVISMVRSNKGGEVGFLADKRRMNVAVTRARRHCALVCDTDTVAADPFLKGLVRYFEAYGEYASAQEYVH